MAAGKRAGRPGLWQVREQGVPAMAGERAELPGLQQVREQGVPGYGM